MTPAEIVKALNITLDVTELATSFIMRLKLALETGGTYEVADLGKRAEALNALIQAGPDEPALD